MAPLPVAALQDVDEILRKQKLADYKAELDRQISEKQNPVEDKRQERKGGLLHPPTPADLFGLLKLCGSEDGVTEYLARLYGMEASTIAPTVHGWIKSLPTVPPPSRQRSAPAAPSSFQSGSMTVVDPRGRQQQQQQPGGVIQICRIKTPPASAPVRNSADISAGLRAINARLSECGSARPLSCYPLCHPCPRSAATHHRAVFFAICAPAFLGTDESAHGRNPLTSTQRVTVGGVGRGTFRASLGPLPPSVPEGAQLDFDFGSDQNAPQNSEVAALAAYMERSKFLHGGTKLAPNVGAGLKGGPSGWNPSF